MSVRTYLEKAGTPTKEISKKLPTERDYCHQHTEKKEERIKNKESLKIFSDNKRVYNVH